MIHADTSRYIMIQHNITSKLFQHILKIINPYKKVNKIFKTHTIKFTAK